jgi:hypothetical protein
VRERERESAEEAAIVGEGEGTDGMREERRRQRWEKGPTAGGSRRGGDGGRRGGGRRPEGAY